MSTHPVNDTAADPFPQPAPLFAEEALKPAREALLRAGLELEDQETSSRVRHLGKPIADLSVEADDISETVLCLRLLGASPERHYKPGTRSANAIVRTVLARVTELGIQEARKAAEAEGLRIYESGLAAILHDRRVGEDNPLACEAYHDGVRFKLDVGRASLAQFRAVLTAAITCGVVRANATEEEMAGYEALGVSCDAEATP